MDYLTVKEAAEKWGISARAVTYQITDGRIPGIIRKGSMWLIPESAPKPLDRRRHGDAQSNTGEVKA